MSKKQPKPQTALAKADSALTRDHIKTYPGWKSDAVRFGIRVADYNAGYIAGSTRHKRKAKR
jgi:hypothetical protein